MNKKILLIAFILLLTGCNVQYEVNISKEGFLENIQINSENESDNQMIEYVNRPIQAIYNSDMFTETNEKLEGVEYYNIEKNLQLPFYKVNINYNFNWYNYQNSYLLYNSVSLFNYNIDDNIIAFYANLNSNPFNSYNGINNLKIIVNIANDYDIVESTADVIENNTLIWNVNKNNYNNKNINFVIEELDKEENEEETETIITVNPDKKDNSDKYFIFIPLAFLFILILIIYLKKYMRR